MQHLRLPTLVTLAWFATVSAVFAQQGPWKLYPSPARGEVAGYCAEFDKHFQLIDGVLTGRCGLGPDFFANVKEGGVFASVGMIWATDESWPKTIGDFELTFDYKWFQDEPMKKYGDFPDLHVGFRLADGKGYYLRWGMLGQVILRRLDGAHDITLAQGTHPGLKGKWAKIKVRAAGPVLKVKVWSEAKPEPQTWTAEAYDNWSSTGDYQRGSVAVGFMGRKHFDTCVYEFKNVQLRPLTSEEASAEKSFDVAEAPAYVGTAKGSDTTEVKYSGLDVEFTMPTTLEGFARDENLTVGGFTAEGVQLSSKDGKPAFFWMPIDVGNKFVGFRAKGTDAARPLLALKTTSADGSTVHGYMDPQWRDGFAALLFESADHTSGAYRYEFKPDVWRDYIRENAHWQKWQIIEPGNPSDRAAFVSPLSQPGRTGKVLLGIGVGGKGIVTVGGTLKK